MNPTPVERYGDVLVKRDDLYSVAGAPGGKARTCWAIATDRGRNLAPAGLVTAGARSSPQVHIVARIARELGAACRVHTPQGRPGAEVAAAVALGAQRIRHLPGYNTVLIARARQDALERGWVHVPFGMEHPEAVVQTAGQAIDLPWDDFDRIVVPVGSGMSLAGILDGMAAAGRPVPVLGVVVGADPTKRLDRFAPPRWRDMVRLVPAGYPYDQHVRAFVSGMADRLDPVYEAKCAQFLRDGDLLWIVGVRPPATTARSFRWMQPQSSPTS